MKIEAAQLQGIVMAGGLLLNTLAGWMSTVQGPVAGRAIQSAGVPAAATRAGPKRN